MIKVKYPILRSYAKYAQRYIRGYRKNGMNWPGKLCATDLSNCKAKVNVLVATSVSGHLTALNFEGVIAKALEIRGANVEALICDSDLPICMDCEYRYYPTERQQENLARQGPKELCISCAKVGKNFYSDLGIKVNKYKDFIFQEDLNLVEDIFHSTPISKIRGYRLSGISVGEHAYAGALRFFARGDLHGLKSGGKILASYFRASMITMLMMQRMIMAKKIDVCVLNHGIYVPQGLISEVCRKMGLRVVTWNPAYKKNCFIFSHETTYHHTLMTESVSNWENLNWDSEKESDIKNYLISRMSGEQDWIFFHDNPDFNRDRIISDLGIDPKLPLIGLLTNVIWDAQLHYPANAFASMMDWIIETIEWFSKRKDMQLAIRIHPAEISGTVPSMQQVGDVIKAHFKIIPSNVFIIYPDNRFSTYSIMKECKAVLIYGTKMGVELSAIGVPVIVAGEAWIRGKGVTFDATSKGQYLSLLEKLPYGFKMNDSQIERAKKYAYHFFFRRMIPVDFMVSRKGWPSIEPIIDKVEDLMPGSSIGLDIICKGIMFKSEFIYDNENKIE
jgi:hypothetical protein